MALPLCVFEVAPESPDLQVVSRPGAWRSGGITFKNAFGLNEETAYFRCLVALCEPTLRNPQSPWIPTSTQIAERLYEYGLIADERDGDWVDRRLDDVRSKLPIGEKPWTADQARSATPEQAKQAMARERSGAPRRTARKEQLVEFAIANGLVTMATVRRLFGSA